MSVDYCPICHSLLEERAVSPCMECGHRPEEIDHTLAGVHTFVERQIFGSLTLVQCDVCHADFDSYDSRFFGLPSQTVLKSNDMPVVRQISTIVIDRDKYCPQCDYRLSFLDFVSKARSLHSVGK
jgi:hypothetical protein